MSEAHAPEIVAALDEVIGPDRMQGDPIPEPEMLIDGLAARGYVIVPAADAEQYADTRRLFDMQWKRSREADALWRAEDPAARAGIWPDLGDLLTWLIERGNTGRVDGAWLSRVLFEARELITMLRDLVELRSKQEDSWSRRVLAEIETFRREQGWPTHGYTELDKLATEAGQSRVDAT